MFKADPFVSFMVFSMGGHLMLLGFHAASPALPTYTIQDSLSGLEVQIMEMVAPAEPVKIEDPGEIINQDDSKGVVEQGSDQNQSVEEKKNISEPVNNTITGAYVEAKPMGRSNPAPIYPRLARQRGWEGVITLRVTINSRGEVSEIFVTESSGHEILDQSALTTIRRWQFVPARHGSAPIDSTIQLPVRFLLTKD